jgi:predicted SAM-dependent methyltransferase
MERFYGRPVGRGIKLHLGCGDWWGDGFLNLDWGVYGGTDMILDLRQKLPFQDAVVEEIQAHDFVEHFSPEEISSMLDDWYRLLVNGGKVVASLPDIGLVMQQYVDKPQDAMHAIYGFGGEHKWGYTRDSLKELFELHKFKNVTVGDSDIHKDEFPRLEVTAFK